jgi:hypothetical protein
MKISDFVKMSIVGLILVSGLWAQARGECDDEPMLVVVGLIEGGAAEAAGIKIGDIVISYHGERVHCLARLNTIKTGVEADSVVISVKRGDTVISYLIPKGQIGLYLKEVLPDLQFDDDAVIIKGIGYLGWDTGESNSFVACLARIAEYLKINKDYTYLMGASGAAFRILFFEDWCPSSPDATVGYDCGTIAAKSINLELTPTFHVDKEGKKDEMIKKIKDSIDKTIPVIAIDLIETAEWGLITGYQKQGNELIVRTYFDRRQNYERAQKFPWIIMTLRNVGGKIDDRENFKNALKIAQGFYQTERYEKYFSGIAAIEYWIKKLKNDDFGGMADEKFETVMLANAWIYDRLSEDRLYAARYLRSQIDIYPKLKDLIEALAVLYDEENRLMTEAGPVTIYPWNMAKRHDWTKAMQENEIEVLNKVLEKERAALILIEKINEKMKG